MLKDTVEMNNTVTLNLPFPNGELTDWDNGKKGICVIYNGDGRVRHGAALITEYPEVYWKGVLKNETDNCVEISVPMSDAMITQFKNLDRKLVIYKMPDDFLMCFLDIFDDDEKDWWFKKEEHSNGN